MLKFTYPTAMDTKTRVKLAMLTLLSMAGVLASKVSATTWQDTVNETLDMVVGLLPKFGDLLTGVGDHLIWPVVYILIILGVASIILGLFGMITAIVFAVVMAVQKFGRNLGSRR